MIKQKVLTLLVLLITAATGAVAQNYKVSVKEGTEDADKWTIEPAEATTTGVPQGTQVTATYAGGLKVKSVKAVKMVPEGINAMRAAYTGDGAPALSWKTGDQVSLFPEAWSTTLTLTPMGTLTATSDDASTVLKGTLETLPTVGDKLNLLFPRAEWSYTGQKGALQDGDEAVMKKFDYATAQVTVATAESGKITATGDADFNSQQAIVKFTLKDKATDNAISASSLKITAAGGMLVQGRGMKKTYFPEGWEPVSSGNKHYLYVETEREIYKDNITIYGNDWKNFRLDATYGTDGQLIVGGKYLYRFVFVEDEWSQGTPNQIVEISMYDNNEPWGSPSYIQFEGSIAYTDDLYLIAAYMSSVTPGETGEGDPVMASTYGPLTVTPASATGELTVALRNELGAADAYSFEATDGDGNKYIFTCQDVNFENGKYYEITMSMEKVAADKYVDLSTMTGDYTAQDGDVLTGQLPSQYRVYIAAGATVTLFNATINTSSWYPAIECTGNATIVLKGSNVISASSEQGSAIKPYYEEGSTLTIQGNGSLTATGKVGIGSGPWDSGRGNLTIAGGNITAIGKQGAGIGGGEMGYFYGNITISGGTVNATGSNGAAGIGSGAENASCGNILISGGTVNATGGSGAPGIGAGNNGSSCGTITITNDVTSVTATKGSGAYNSIGKGNSGWGTCGTITIGGTVYPDGITDSPYTYVPSAAPTAYTLAESTQGMIVGTNGLAYDVADKDNLPTGVTAAGVVVYKNGSTGLAIALEDEASMMDWATACGESGAAAHTPTVEGQTWKLPSQEEWTLVKNANSGSSLNSAITNAGGTAIPTVHFDHETQTMTGQYWLSTQGAIDESARTWGINGYDEIVTDSQSLKTDNLLVRACLAW